MRVPKRVCRTPHSVTFCVGGGAHTQALPVPKRANHIMRELVSNRSEGGGQLILQFSRSSAGVRKNLINTKTVHVKVVSSSNGSKVAKKETRGQ